MDDDDDDDDVDEHSLHQTVLDEKDSGDLS